MDYHNFKKRLDLAIDLNKKEPKNYAKIGKVLKEIKNFQPEKNITSAN